MQVFSMSVLGGQFFQNNLHPWLNRNAEYLYGVIAVYMGNGQKRKYPKPLLARLETVLECFGSAYGSRTRDLRLERAASLATRRMRLTAESIITPLLLFVKCVFGFHAFSQRLRERDMLEMPRSLDACFSSVDACYYSLRKSMESNLPLW